MRTTWILAALFVCTGCARMVAIPVEDRQEVSKLKVFVDTTRGDNRLVVAWDAYGSPPELERRDCIRGNCLHFYLISGATGRTVWRDNIPGEAGPEVTFDYSELEKGTLRLTLYSTFTPPDIEGDEPLWMKTITVDRRGSCAIKTEILLKPEEGDDQRIDRLRNMATKAFEAGDSKAMDDYTAALWHLRNISLKRPGPVLAAMKTIPSDGHYSCIKGDIHYEIEMLYEMREGKPLPEDLEP